ncbi:MAG: DUF4907 domain-containing protein [Bacteroidota bacterium]
MKTFKVSIGWGYEIRVRGKTLIYQDFIPAIQGEQGFASREDALKTGEYVIYKLKKGLNPGLNHKELDSLKIFTE